MLAVELILIAIKSRHTSLKNLENGLGSIIQLRYRGRKFVSMNFKVAPLEVDDFPIERAPASYDEEEKSVKI